MNAADTVDLLAGFLDAPENVDFLRSLAIPRDKLALVLSMRDTAEEGQPPFWAEVKALRIGEQERKQWEWALTEAGAQHTYRDIVKQVYTTASIGWAYGSSSMPGIIGDYLRVRKCCVIEPLDDVQAMSSHRELSANSGRPPAV